MKQLIIMLSAVLLTACTMERTNRTLTQFGDSQPDVLGLSENSSEAVAEISLAELKEEPAANVEPTSSIRYEPEQPKRTAKARTKSTQHEENVSFVTIEKRKHLAALAKKSHGLMHIHRYGPGFDVLMTLDTGDSDVSFSMKLPSAASDTQNTMRSDMLKSAEEIAEQNRQVFESLDDDKAELHHDEFEQRKELMEQKKIQDFQASTKHIFSAQSLFYKKQYWQALDETNKALELVPNSAQAHALKGSIYYKMGLNDEAKSSWLQALEIDPSMEQVKAGLARLR